MPVDSSAPGELGRCKPEPSQAIDESTRLVGVEVKVAKAAMVEVVEDDDD